MSEHEIEKRLHDLGKTAPRVKPQDVDAEIVGEEYHVFANTMLTICALKLRNGFVVTGESACADPANFDAEVGRDVARLNARNKIWPLLGFRLRDQLSGI